MNKITLKIDGMKCGMCESHVNDVVRKCAEVKKVTSSHAKGETVILCENDVDEKILSDAIAAQGYRVLSCVTEPYEKRGIFGLFRK